MLVCSALLLPTDIPATPTPAPPTDAPTPAVATVVITKVHNLSKSEHVVIQNIGRAPADLSLWHLYGARDHDDRRDDYVFPSGFVLEPGSTVTLHSGENGVRNPPSDVYWTTSCVWNNQGEIVYLRDREGNLVDSYEYS